MEPNLFHLKYFAKAAELGSVAAAAKELNISQPAISQAIRKLEETLQCELLVHTKNRFKLTPAGIKLASRARGLLLEVQSLREDLLKDSQEVRGPLNISTSSAVAFSLLPGPLKKILKEHPGIEPRILFGSVREIQEQVRSGQAELGIVIDETPPPGFHHQLLAEGRFTCILKSGLSTPAAPRFLCTQESPGREHLEKQYRRHSGNQEPPAFLTVESWEVIAQMTAQGLGVGLVPDFVADVQSGLRKVSEYEIWASRIRYRTFLIHQGKHQLSRVASAFLSKISEPAEK